jgi:hypothetical protein
LTPTVSTLAYRRRIQVVNAAAWVAEQLGLPLGRLDVDSILAAARRSTGLEDAGDPRFLEPMSWIVEACAGSPDVTPLARIVLRQTWIRATQNRLHLQDWLRRRPDVLEQPVHRPIFVVGFPRTGTTVLQNVLAIDPSRRGLTFWELLAPVPLHDDVAKDRHVRRRMARTTLRAAYQIAPEMTDVHAIDADSLEECWPLFGNTFCVMNWDLQSGLRAYGDRLLAPSWDMRPAYREVRRTYQVLLERGGPGRAPSATTQLVLKCPEHLWFLDALLDTFPDACVVWTHRDPYETLSSYCSLISMQWRTLYGVIDRPRIGAHVEERLLGGIGRAMAARASHDPRRFFDVRFPDLVRDPAAVVDEILRWFDLPRAEGHDAAVARYLGTKRSDERGRHHYDGRLFGLDADRIRARFADYVSAFLSPDQAA